MGLLPLEKGPQDHLFRGKLVQLFRLIVANQGSSQMDFSRMMQTNRSNVARWILQLDRMELITRVGVPGTARTSGIFLTERGKELALSRRFLAGADAQERTGEDDNEGEGEGEGDGDGDDDGEGVVDHHSRRPTMSSR